MMRMTWRATVALAVLHIGMQGALAAPASKTFRDWIAGCDNLRSCTALSLPGEAAEHAVFLKLTRSAGSDAAAALELKIRAEKLESAFDLTMALDGTSFPASGKRWKATSIDGEVVELALTPSETDALIAVARKATKLSVSLPGRDFEVSLAGSVAAMLWIDEQQGRLDTTSALIRRGAGTAVPAAPALPVITARVAAQAALPGSTGKTLAAALRRYLKQTDSDACEDIPEGFGNSDDAWPLAGGARLVGLACSRGAYNFATGFWIVSGADVAKARKAAFPEPGGGQDNMIVNGEFDPETAQVNFFNKGRGIGDCGASGNYAWTGKAFVLTAFTEMGECKGIPRDDWLTLFRSDVKVAK